MKKLSLNERQLKALLLWKEEKEILSNQYQEEFSIADRTALRDLTDLIARGLLLKVGEKKTTKYVFKTK